MNSFAKDVYEGFFHIFCRDSLNPCFHKRWNWSIGNILNMSILKGRYSSILNKSIFGSTDSCSCAITGKMKQRLCWVLELYIKNIPVNP